MIENVNSPSEIPVMVNSTWEGGRREGGIVERR
jgi:hypothetical protein